MKELEDLDLKPKDLLKVRGWLDSWYQHFNSMADNVKVTVERYNLEELDFFFFTECIDILSKNPESKGVEDNKVIQKRKRAVEYSLIFRRLLGEELNKKRPCSHCGNDDRVISSLGDGTGHYVFCEKCGMTTIVTYPVGYETCIKRVCEDLTKRGLATKIPKPKTNQGQLDMKYQNYLKNKYDNPMTYDEWLTEVDNIVTKESEEKPKLPKTPPLKTVPKFLEKEKMETCDTCNRLLPKKDFSYVLNQCNLCYTTERANRPVKLKIQTLDESQKENQPPKKKGRTVPLNG